LINRTLIVICIFLFVSACTSTPTEQSIDDPNTGMGETSLKETANWYEEGDSLVWQFSKNGKSFFLLGDFPLSATNTAFLDDASLKAFTESEALILRLGERTSEQNLADLSLQFGKLKERSLESLLDPESFKKLELIMLENRISERFYQNFQPWVLYKLVEESLYINHNLGTQNSLSTYFQTQALDFGVPILFLQSFEEEIQRSAAQPIEIQAQKLRGIVNAYDQFYETLLTKQQLYLEKNLLDYYNSGQADPNSESNVLNLEENKLWFEIINQIANNDFSDALSEKARSQALDLNATEQFCLIINLDQLIGNDGLIQLLKSNGFSGGRL
jgi:uncharacterized protein YbaP (TraB family)